MLQTKQEWKKKVEDRRKRYAALDILRGFILVSMILYHGIWDIVYLFGAQWEWFGSGLAYTWQQSICWSFLLLSGFCWHFGKTKWKRGLQVFGAGIAVSLVTVFLMPEGQIIFGVLTLIGSSMLLLIPLDKVLRHVPPVLGFVLSFIAFVITRNVNGGYLGFESWNWMALPENLYANYGTTYLGFMHQGFYSADYFSLVPWLFLYVAGYFLYGIIRKQNWLSVLDVKDCLWTAWLEWMGRHSLIIYMLHQPVIYGVLYLVTFM